MSDLNKFQTTEDWRANFRKFLFMERKPETIQSRLTVTESQRYSLDIGDELKNIIEQKTNQKTIQMNSNDEKIQHTTSESYQSPETNSLKAEISDKSNMNPHYSTAYEKVPMCPKTDENYGALGMCEKTVSDPNSILLKYEEHKNNNALVWQKMSDESFEALERMCDKTASDPNSTLFQYLHSDCKEQLLAEVKKRSTDGSNLCARNDEDNLLMKITNCTLLDDVEAPSRMWENSICGDTILQTSPVKRVGLLRPSTILEEAPDDSANSDISSQMSFRTATKGAQSNVSSSSYETGEDFICASKICQPQEVDDVEVDRFLLNTLLKSEKKECIEAEIISPLEMMNATIIEGTSSFSGNNCNISDVSVDLIDFEKTFAPLHGSPHSSTLGESEAKDFQKIENELENVADSSGAVDYSVIELLSDDEFEDGQNVDNQCCIDQEIPDNIKTIMSSARTSFTISNGAYCCNEPNGSDKENFAETNEQSENSIQLNDTMEEVEYMLKKRLEYMAAEAAKKVADNNEAPSACNNQVSRTLAYSPIKQIETVKYLSSTSKAKSFAYTTPAKKTPLTKGHSSTSKHFGIDISPFPKFDIFSKPSVHPYTKELTGKQKTFSHIVSPIGTYMKKTAQRPLMSSINCQNKNYFNSTAILELENERRLYQPHFATNLHGSEEMGPPKLPGVIGGVKRPLPKKAYIASDLKHIVDERTPVTIPGGKKIQKYLENAMMPAVLRHDGKLKMPCGINNKLNSSTALSSEAPSKLPLKISDKNSHVYSSDLHVRRRNKNVSLADLSLMSGDVSMYTIMDAQKF